jgi:hypothetical protein
VFGDDLRFATGCFLGHGRKLLLGFLELERLHPTILTQSVLSVQNNLLAGTANRLEVAGAFSGGSSNLEFRGCLSAIRCWALGVRRFLQII